MDGPVPAKSLDKAIEHVRGGGTLRISLDDVVLFVSQKTLEKINLRDYLREDDDAYTIYVGGGNWARLPPGAMRAGI